MSATVTFSAAVTVTGTPQLEIDVGGTPEALDYSSGSGSTALVFTGYTVAANDEDTDGLSIAANKLTLNSGTIKASAGDNPDAVLDHAAVAASANHKVDGIRPTLVTTGDNAPRTSTDGTKIILTFSENVDLQITATFATFFPVSVAGTAATVDLAEPHTHNSIELTLASTDTVAVGNTVTAVLLSGVVADLAGNQNAALAATSVLNTVVTLPGKPTGLTVGTVTPTKIPLSWTASTNAGGYSVERAPDVSGSAGTWAAVWSGNVTSYTDTDLTPGTKYHYRVSGINSGGTGAASDSVSGTTAALPVVTITAQNATVTEGSRATFIISRTGYDVERISVLVTLTATGDMGITTGSRTFTLFTGTALATYNANSTGDAVDEENGSVTARLLTDSDGVIINGYTIGTPASATVTVEDDDTVPGTPVVSALGHDTKLVLNWPMPAEGTSSITGYDYRYKTTAGAEATWSTWTDTGLSGSDASNDFEITGLTNGTDYTVEVRAESLAGYSIAGSANATPTPPPIITSVAITSDPGADNTYIIGDAFVVTITFDKNITLTSGSGSPPIIAVLIGSGSRTVPCLIPTPPTMELVCNAAIDDGDGEDSDGISLPRNTLATSDRMIVGPLGQIANLDYSRLADDSNHKVDGVKPTVSSAEAMEDSLTIKFSEALDEDSTPATSAFTLNVDSGTAPTVSSVDIDGSNVTLSLSAAVDTSKTYTIDYAAPMTSPIKDLVGNAAEDVSTQSVSTEDTTAPELTEATTLSNDAVLLSYDEVLDPNSVPDKSQFTVKVGETARTVTGVGTSGAMGITLTLSSSSVFRPGDTLTVSYAVPTTNPLKDEAGNEAAGFTDEPVTNNLAATAPDAPGNLTASPGTDTGTMELTWETPWDNGNAITKFQVRYAAGTSVPAATTWDDITGSGASTTSHTVTGLTTGTEYTFEVSAVNRIGNGVEASVTETVLAPVWEFTLTDSNGDAVTELTEGGDSATATVSITNGVTFGTDQTVTLEWGGSHIRTGEIQGTGGTDTITILAGESSGSLEIRSPQYAVDNYSTPWTRSLTAMHGGTEIGSIDLTRLDDEEPPVATLTAAPAQVSEGEAIEVEVRLSLPYGGNATSTLQLIVTDAAGALVAPLPTGAQFDAGELTHAITLTAADNAVHNDGARVVTVALAPSPDASLYTLGAPSSATVVVTDNDNVAPVFSDGASATRSVAENTAAGENVGAALTATDTDAGDTLTYTLEGADAASFDIVSTSGQIRTRPGVTYDHEARSSYSVTVKADDGNAGTATVAVTITVTDVAEPPAAPAAPTVTATSASTTSVDVTWTAPANPGKPAISGYDLRYRAGTGGSWTDGPQNRTGASASIASLTAGTSYQVQVRATNAEGDGPWSDSGSGSTGTSSNAAPTFANPTATRSVPENSAAGTNVGAVVTATDTDAGDTLAYTLEGADAASFDIVSTSGQIRTRPGVTYDHEARSSYSVTVKADDGNAGTATIAVTITVTDVAEPPAAPAAPAVTATSASTTSVDVAWTAPANPGKPAISGYDLRYRAGTGGSWTDGPQNLTGASASIASLTAGTSYQVQVRATNAEGDGPWSASGTGSTGTASNTAPAFANPTATRSVPENSAADTNVGAVVTATDTDAGDTLTYTLEGADAASFDIVSTSGQIRTRPGVTYDHEARSSYSVTVKADDGNAGTATIAVTITVTDVAEPPAAPAAPAVTATSASTTSVDVTWTAPANPGKPAISGYDLRYRAGTGGSWTDGPQDRTGASASIASLTAGTSYQVQVRATNAEGDGPWSASGTGSTGTASNAAPTFANPTAARSVPENSAADTNVGAVVTATDTDAGDTLTYTLEGADAASFDIVSTSGQIRTRPGVTYDHEARSSYSVTVKADDGNAGTATTAVTITVTDVAEPPAAPAAPTVTATSASTTSVDVAWTAPANPGKPDHQRLRPALPGGHRRELDRRPAEPSRRERQHREPDRRHLLPGAGARHQRRGRRPLVRLGQREHRHLEQRRADIREPDGHAQRAREQRRGHERGGRRDRDRHRRRRHADLHPGGRRRGLLRHRLDLRADPDQAGRDLRPRGQVELLRHRQGRRRQRRHRHHRGDDHGHGRGRAAGGTGRAGRHGDLRKHHERGCDLDRAGQPGQASHQRLRPALPGGHRRELDRRPAGPDRRERQHREPDRRHLLPGAGARHQRRGRRPLVRLGQREHRHLEQRRPGCAAVADRGRREPGGDAEVACAGIERRERDPAIPVPATVRVPGLWRLDGHRGQCSGGGQCEQLHRDGAARQCPVPIRGAGGEHRRPRRGIERGRRNTGASQRAPCVAESVDGPVRPNRGDPGRGRDRGPVLGRRERGG